jgi:hypothetical protein
VVKNIIHNPIFDTLKIEDHYSKKDGVDVKYVCTSAPNEYGTYAADIFYRETPHPEFGNRYFGLYLNHDNQIMITNADIIEDLEFTCIEDSKGDLHYSAHRHDYKVLDNENMMDEHKQIIVDDSPTECVKVLVDGKEISFGEYMNDIRKELVQTAVDSGNVGVIVHAINKLLK